MFKGVFAATAIIVTLAGNAQAASVLLDNNPLGLNTDTSADNFGSGVNKINTLFGKLPIVKVPYLGNIATGIYYPTFQNTTAKQISFRSPHRVWNAGQPVTHAAVRLPCSYVTAGGGETLTGAPTLWTASIEYPAGNFNQETFSGATSGSCVDGQSYVGDDIVLSVPIPDGARVWVNGHGVNAAGVVYKLGYADVNDGGATNYGVTTPDYTMSAGISDLGNAYLTDLGLLTTTQQRSFVLYGDSRCAGYGTSNYRDLYTDGPDIGNVARSVGRFAPYINTCVSGDRQDVFLANGHADRIALSANASDAIIEMGINDITAGNTATKVESDLNSFRALLPSTMPVSITTQEPVTTNTPVSVTTLVANNNGLTGTVGNSAYLFPNEVINIQGATPTTDNGLCTILSIVSNTFNCISSVATGTATATGTITYLDLFQNPVNQTVSASNSVRIAVNNYKRSLPLSMAGFSHVFDIADVMESGRDSGKWGNGTQFGIPLASFFAETGDGTHELSQAYVQIQRSGVISPSTVY